MSTSIRPTPIAWIILGWFAVSLAAGAAGLFQVQGPPVALGAAIALPPVLVLALLAWSGRFQRWARSQDLRMLALLQTWRVVGLAFVALWSVDRLPAGFALPAGFGDIAMGVTAPFVAAHVLGRRGPGKAVFYSWTAFGVIDLLAAVALGVLYSPTSLGILAGDTADPVMGVLPMSIIPSFGVPFTLALHAISVHAARHADWSAPAVAPPQPALAHGTE